MDHVPNVPVAHAVDPPRDRDAKYAMIGYHECTRQTLLLDCLHLTIF